MKKQPTIGIKDTDNPGVLRLPLKVNYKQRLVNTPTQHFTTANLTKLHDMFSDEKEYREHLNSLWKTRSGLRKIIETYPHLRSDILPHFNTINILIDALLPEPPSVYPYPPYSF